MKLSSLLLTALSAAVLTACEKSDVQPTTGNTTQLSVDTAQNSDGDNPQEPYDCPACGMG